ncbi:glycoside hydrolase family 19 protein [Amycolatopsis sp.]|uniref:glycoside hydrolase family 19 protein n=1 Tax=Amycolatopsis sp. TaxID=37632 RepID=UPI002D7E70BA|nr:glycoside hydrolase family 19 protein [Amycolatopsis sp.]HET6706991.1 glycoside hydrolase family 19 protein [Amycolatopsis sp.]
MSTLKRTLGRAATAALVAGIAFGGLQTTASAGELPPGAARIGVLAGGKLLVKEGNLYASWVDEMSGVTKFEIAGDRIGVLTADSKLFVKEGNLWTDWVEEAGNVRDFRLAGNRIGVVRNDGTAAVKDGTLSANWVEQTSGVKDLELTPDRVGVVFDNGLATVKEGNLYSPWVDQTGAVADLELSADRIGVLRTDGTVAVKESNLWSNWVEETSGVKQLELSGSRIGVVLDNGLATVKEGNLYASWVNQLAGAANLQIAGDRIGVLRTDGSVTVKDGGLYGTWVEQANGVQQLGLAAAGATAGGSQVSMADITAVYGATYATDTVAAGLPSLNAEMAAGGITTPSRKAALLATLKHESGFRYNAGEAGNPEVYRGRGFIQLTNDFNYRSAGTALGYDFLGNPDAAATLDWSAKIARWYWTSRNINAAADNYDMGAVGRAIGYSYALDPTESLNRCADYKKALAYFNGGSLPVADGAINCTR